MTNNPTTDLAGSLSFEIDRKHRELEERQQALLGSFSRAVTKGKNPRRFGDMRWTPSIGQKNSRP